jgi:hypothetical protein
MKESPVDNDPQTSSAPTSLDPSRHETWTPTATPVEPVRITPKPGRSRGARLLNVALGGALALAVAGVAFAAGRVTAPAASGFVGANGLPGGQFGNRGNGGGQQGGPGAFTGGGGLTIEGTVESVTATTLTIKTAAGDTVQIALSPTTTYHAQSDATSSDVASGGKVLVRVGGRIGGPAASPGTGATGPTANDVTVVP